MTTKGTEATKLKTTIKKVSTKKVVENSTNKTKTTKATYNAKHPTTKYALNLIAGDIICCKAEVQLAKKHIRDLERQGKKGFPYVFDESRADRAFEYTGMCINPDTNEYYKELPHQQFDDGILYGWVHKDTGNRKYTKVYKQEAKGQAKTTTCAIKAMYALTADRIYPPGKPDQYYIVPNAKIDLMAVDREQAKELREPIVEISKCSPNLRKRIDAKRSFIRSKTNGGEIRVLSKELSNKQGGKPNVVIIDELSSHRDGKRAAVAEGNLGKKGQSLLIIITTAGDSEETNPAKREYDYAKKVLSGKIIDENYLPIIREVEDGDDIHDTNLWQKSHPMFRYLGKYDYANVLYEAVLKLYKRAYEGDDAELKRQFLIFRMNRWQERAINSYLSEKQVKQLDKLAVSVDEYKRLTYGLPKVLGFDFALNRDLTAYAEVIILEDGRIAIDGHGYILRRVLKEKEKSDKVEYSTWARRGWVSIVDYENINNSIIANGFLNDAREREQDILMACFDRTHATELMIQMIDGTYGDGMFNKDNCIALPQHTSHLHDPTTMLRNAIIEEKIVWNGNPLLKWCLMNAFEYRNKTSDMIRIGKETPDSPRRIDLAAAVIFAFKKIDVLKDIDDVADRILEQGYSL